MNSVSFNGTSLSTNPYTVKTVRHESMTDRDIFQYQLARESGAIMVNSEWKPKKIIIEGTIKGASSIELETNIDSFKRELSYENKNLDVEYISGTRRYVATAQNITIERDHYHLTMAPYSVEFFIPSGFGQSTSASTHQTQSIAVTSLETDSFVVGGTVEPFYSIQLDFEVANSVSKLSCTINGDRIEMNEAISAGQTVVIDAENKKITIDGVEKRYNGLFPRLVLGTNNYVIGVSSSSHRYDVLVTYTPKYL